MNLRRRILSIFAVLMFTLTGPVGAIFAQTPGATPAYDPARDPALQHISSPQNYDRTDWPAELNCGLFGGDDAEAALSKNKPLADYLSNWLGMPVKWTTGTSYNAVIESMRAGHTNCGTVGSFSYILAVQEANAEALAVSVTSSADTPVYNPALQPAYYSVISTVKGSGITNTNDLKGHTFSFVDPASTSGHLIPKAGLLKAGIDPDKEMKTVFAGSHPTSGLAIWNKKVDAGATTETTFRNLMKEGQTDACFWADGEIGIQRSPEELKQLFAECPDGKMVPIWYSDPIPNAPFSVRGDLPPSLKQAIKDALLATPQNPEFIAATGRWYIDPNIDQKLGLKHLDNYYDGLREIAKLLNLDLKSLE